MGGVPCAKILINRRVDAELKTLLTESQATTELLLIKGNYETPALNDIIDYENELLSFLISHKKKFRTLNDKFAQEKDYE